MVKQSTQKIAAVAAFMLLTGQGCGGLLSGKQELPPNGGLYVSENGGQTWQQRVLIPSVSGQPGSIATVNVRTLTMDPSDKKTLYMGTAANGLVFTYDQGRTWQQAADIRTGSVYDITVDPKDKCNITIAAANKIMRSGDCSRTFAQVFIEQSPNVVMRSIVTHPVDSSLMFAGSSNGNLLASSNAGQTWTSLHRFNGSVLELLIQPDDTNVMYALIERRGIFKSADRGQTWIDITPNTKTYRAANEVKHVAWDTKQAKLYLASTYGIHVSNSGGDSWDALGLLTAPGEANITALSVNPAATQNVLYATASATTINLYGTSDGGKTWASAVAPTTRSISEIVFDPEAPHIIYAAAFASQ